MSLFIISGSSQSGKTTLINLLLKEKNIVRIITATSRKPRLGEKDKVDYYFLKKSDFKNKSKFIETAIVHGNYYGTLKKELDDKLKSGKNVIWIMDVQGVKYVLDNYKELPKNIVTIFLTPIKLSILLSRIQLKNDINMEKRITSIKEEVKQLNLFNYIIDTSKNVENSLNDLKTIINNDKNNIKKIVKFTKNFDINYFINN